MNNQDKNKWIIVLKSTIICGMISAILLVLCVIGYAWSIQPAVNSSVSKKWSGAAFKIHRGQGYMNKDTLVVTGVGTQRRVRIVLETVPFHAKNYPFMEWNFSRLGPRTGMFVGWITKENPGQLYTMPAILPWDDKAVYRMNANPDWQGEIVALGLGFEGQMYEPIQLKSVSVQYYSMSLLLESMWDEWTGFSGWSQRSINAVEIGSKTQLINQVPLVSVWVLVSIFCYLVKTKLSGGDSHIEVAFTICLLGWLVLDIMWQINLIRQNKLSNQLYAGKSLEEKISSGEDSVLYELANKIKECSEKNRTITFPYNYLYMSQRVRYFILPKQSSGIAPWRESSIRGTCFFVTSDIHDTIENDVSYQRYKDNMPSKEVEYFSNQAGKVYYIR